MPLGNHSFLIVALPSKNGLPMLVCSLKLMSLVKYLIPSQCKTPLEILWLNLFITSGFHIFVLS